MENINEKDYVVTLRAYYFDFLTAEGELRHGMKYIADVESGHIEFQKRMRENPEIVSCWSQYVASFDVRSVGSGIETIKKSEVKENEKI